MSRITTKQPKVIVYQVPEADRRPGCPQIVAYARLSRDPQGNLIAVTDQINVMVRDAQAKGLDLVRVWFDDDLSAWRTDINRPGWNAYLAELASGTYAGAMSYHSDRLARNGRDGEAFLAVMVDRELPLYTPGQTLDLGTSGDARLMARIGFAVAINQSDATSRRLIMRKDEARLRGNLRYVLGSRPPLGFEDGPEDWQTETSASLVLTDMAKRLLAGEPLAKAWSEQPELWLPAYGHLPAKRVTEKMIRAALQRPVTAGFMTDRAGKIMPEVTTTCTRNGEPPLDPDLWLALQPQFAARKRQGDQPRDSYWAGKVLACANCGNQMSGEIMYDRRGKVVVKSWPSYRCKNQHLQPDGTYNRPCRGVSIAAAEVHDLLRAAVLAWAETSERYRQASANQAGLGDQATRLHGQVEHQRAVLGILGRDLAAGMPIADYEAARAQVAATTAQLEAELADIAVAQANPRPAVIAWDDLSPDRMRALVADAFVTPIKVAPGNGGGRALTALDRIKPTPRP
jgi:DNA invertase Pin-like site-specific DNA recombinase